METGELSTSFALLAVLAWRSGSINMSKSLHIARKRLQRVRPLAGELAQTALIIAVLIWLYSR